MPSSNPKEHLPVTSPESELVFRDSEQGAAYSLLKEFGSDICFAIDPKMESFISVSGPVERLLGYSIPEATGLGPGTMLKNEEKAAVCERMRRRLAEHTGNQLNITLEPLRLQLVAKDKRNISAEVCLMLLLRHDHTIRTIQGIVRSCSIEPAVGNEEEITKVRFRELFNNMRSGCVVYESTEGEEDFIIRDFNRSAEKIDKIKREEVIGKKVSEVFPGVKSLGLFSVFQLVARDGEGRFHPVSLYKDNRIVGWRENFVYRLPDGKIVAVYEDATDRKMRELALQESECRQRALLEGVPDTIIMVNPSGEVIDCKTEEGPLSIPQEQIPGYSIYQLFPSEAARKQIRSNLKKVLAKGILKEIDLQLGDAVSSRVFEMRIVRENEKTAIMLIRDVTEQRRAEMELVKSQRLESLGVLAGGIAHDFNNLLGLIFGQIDMALDTMDPFSEPAQKLQKTIRAFERARDLTGQLLTFSKGKAPVKKTVDIRELLRDSVALALSGSNVSYSIYAPDEQFTIEADPGQLTQVFNNLLINARQAMVQGGRITIELSDELVTDTALPIRMGRYFKMKLRDEGCGIPPEKLGKIFDPFYTTKEAGSGLGLAVAYSIISWHGGTITAESTVGKGTCFTILLPEGRPAVREGKGAVPVQQQKFDGKVLIMDDEEILRDIASQMCRRLGLEIETASNGKDAVEMYRAAFREGTPYDAVLLDMTIAGGMGGIKTAEALKKIDPEVKNVVMSGYADHEVMSDPRKFGFKAVLSKPFRLNEMGKVLGEVIGARSRKK